jgi:hypothetical protein
MACLLPAVPGTHRACHARRAPSRNENRAFPAPAGRALDDLVERLDERVDEL